MCAKESGRKSSSRRHAAAAVVAGCLATVHPARAGGLWDAMLEGMNLKAPTAAPGPAFVERTRPDPAGLDYLPAATPHRVSPLPVKTPNQIQIEENALDAAQQRQLNPATPKPLQAAKAASPTADAAPAAKTPRRTKAKSADAVAD